MPKDTFDDNWGQGIRGLKRQGEKGMANSEAERMQKIIDGGSADNNAVESVRDGENFNKKHFKW